MACLLVNDGDRTDHPNERLVGYPALATPLHQAADRRLGAPTLSILLPMVSSGRTWGNRATCVAEGSRRPPETHPTHACWISITQHACLRNGFSDRDWP